jgi:NAD+ kinase
MRLFVLGNAERPGVTQEAERLLPFLRERAEVVVFDLRQEVDLVGLEADLTLVLGGDGAILRAARQMGYRQVPVLGINLGRLGFLADLALEEFVCCFDQVLAGHCRVTRHLMFECVVEAPEVSRGPSSAGRVERDDLFDPVVPSSDTTLHKPIAAPGWLGLNEITIHTGPPFHMLELDLIINGEPVSRYTGDGLIVSTPIGSTAHSLSAGGPILGQELDAFVVTPICPHTLTNRPVVDSADKVYTINVRRASGSCYLVIDGQEHRQVAAGQCVTVRRAPVAFQLVKCAGRSFYQTLHDKLNWGTQPNYRHEPGSGEHRTTIGRMKDEG